MNSELIYVHIERISHLKGMYRQGFNISNEYDISFDYGEWNGIEYINIKEKEDIYKGIYSPFIKNINVLEGINGTGKTSILHLLGTTRNTRKGKIYDWSFFLIYKCGEQYVLEGNDLGVINDLVIDMNDTAGFSEEFSLLCEYEVEKRKFRFIDKCREGDKRSKYNKILYYRDNALDSTRINTIDRTKDVYKDAAIFTERIDVLPDDYNICTYMHNEYINAINKKSIFQFPNFKGKMTLSNELSLVLDCDNTSSFNKKTFILQLLLFWGQRSNLFSDNDEYKNEWKSVLDKMETLRNASEAYLLLDKICMIYRKKGCEEILRLKEKFLKLDEDYFVNNEILKSKNRRLLCDGIEFYIGDRAFIEFLRIVYAVPHVSEIIRITYSTMSAGEAKIIEVFSGLSTVITETERNYIVLLDEPEKGLHPEMSRQFINNLVQYANMLGQEKQCTFQFIITSHSPFIMSDIPKPYIHCLHSVISDEGYRMIKISNAEEGLLSNIPDIMKKTFFLKRPFGEFANEYFKSLVMQIKQIKTYEQFKCSRILDVIENIEEPTIKGFLIKSYEEQLKNILDTNELIIYYEKQIEKLREKQW